MKLLQVARVVVLQTKCPPRAPPCQGAEKVNIIMTTTVKQPEVNYTAQDWTCVLYKGSSDLSCRSLEVDEGQWVTNLVGVGA